MDDDLTAALDHDPTPPIVVLRHLAAPSAASLAGTSAEPAPASGLAQAHVSDHDACSGSLVL